MRRCILFIGLGLLLGCSKADNATDGEKLYNAACARCHGETGAGGQSLAGVQPRDLSDPAWQKTVRDEELRDLIQQGRGQMPGFGDALSLDKIDKVVKHLRVLKRPEN